MFDKVFLCTWSELLCIPWLNDICNLPASTIKGNIPNAINVIYQLKINEITNPTIIVVVFYRISPIK